MNAYQLADELKACIDDGSTDLVCVCGAVNMLRQLADELKACKIHDRRGWEYAEELEQERRKQADRIAELEKTMGERLNDLNTRQVEDARTSLVNTPPYAYAVVQGKDGRENVSLQFDHPEMCGQQYKQAIPLYTTPQTKPLSDDYQNKYIEQYWIKKPLSDDGGINNALGFRAIKCIVKDCENHRGEGSFTGDLCNPCHEFITKGKGIYSQAYRNTQTKPLSDEEIVYLAKRFEGVWDGAVDYKRFARAIEAKVRAEK